VFLLGAQRRGLEFLHMGMCRIEGSLGSSLGFLAGDVLGVAGGLELGAAGTESFHRHGRVRSCSRPIGAEADGAMPSRRDKCS
jgi:hypothetical protein